MQQPTERSTIFQGNLMAGGASFSPASLSVKPTQITLHCHFLTYSFLPHQVAAIEGISSKTIFIRHILSEYPSQIYFSPSPAVEEIIESIGTVGFIPSASMEDVPHREGIPVRLKIIIPGAILVIVILHFIENFIGLNDRLYLRFRKYGPIQSSFLLLFSILIQYVPIVQRFILRTGRQIGEIKPILQIIVLISTTCLIVSLTIMIGVPELIAVILSFFVVSFLIRFSRSQME